MKHLTWHPGVCLALGLLVASAIRPALAETGTTSELDDAAILIADEPIAGQRGPALLVREASLTDTSLETVMGEDVTADMFGDGSVCETGWGFQVLPDGLIYRSYFGGPKESRMATTLISIPDDSTMWDGTLGARVGIFRIGTYDPIRPQGFQFDIEGSAQVRLDIPEDVDVRGTDYRVGLPLTWGDLHHQWKFAYYHMSSHLGDEFMVKNEGFPLFAQARDALVLGHSYYATDWLRLYAEVGWAFYSNYSEPWEVQFGFDYAPRIRTGLHGAPFVTANAYLREELDFGGGLTVQAGWAWRADTTAHLLRMGLQYYNGASTQYAFLPFHEQQIGVGLWYDW